MATSINSFKVLEPDLIVSGDKVVYRSEKEQERDLVRLVAFGAVRVVMLARGLL